MPTYIIVSVASGVLFAVLDAVINANPLARKLYQVYQPIARTSFNPVAGILVDLVFGFVMAGVFLLLYPSLPGQVGLVKGISYGVLMWFFRLVMYAASQWVMFNIPGRTIIFILVTGLAEMLLLGLIYGLTLAP